MDGEEAKRARSKQVKANVCAVLKKVGDTLTFPARKIGAIIGKLFTGKSEASNENDQQQENE